MSAGRPNEVEFSILVFAKGLASPPFIQLIEGFGGLVRVALDEALVGHAVAADDGVPEVQVRGVVVAHGRGAGVARGDGGPAAAEGAAIEDQDPGAAASRVNGGLPPGAARADDDDVRLHNAMDFGIQRGDLLPGARNEPGEGHAPGKAGCLNGSCRI